MQIGKYDGKYIITREMFMDLIAPRLEGVPEGFKGIMVSLDKDTGDLVVE